MPMLIWILRVLEVFRRVVVPQELSLQLSTSRSWLVSVTTSGGAYAYGEAISTIRIKNSSGTDLAAKTIQLYVALGI